MPSPSASVYAPIKIYTRAASGRFTRLRWLMVWLTQIVFYATPWLQWNGRQAVLFDLEARRFYLFNLVLYPQDFIYLTLLLILCALGLFFVTTLAGRIWCGFACPQTVYTKVFMWLQQRFEGDRSARMRRDAAPWSAQKLARKSGTQISWVALSLWTGFTFVAYFTPAHTLAAAGLQGGWGPWEMFWVFFYALALYGNAGYLREQVCKHMCPYARFQSAMFDADTLIIGYDAQRGEPRGKPAADKAAGDCIDCTLCVQVCPTGIDIRDGLQSNCIGCAACIDACDDVMTKIGAPIGLVRYSTHNAMEQGRTHVHWREAVRRPRVLVYGGLLLAVAVGLVAGLALRKPLKVNVIRDRGVMARTVEYGAVENVYRLQVMHALEHAQRYRIAVQGEDGVEVRLREPVELELASAEERSVPVAVRLGADQALKFSGQSVGIRFSVQAVGEGTSVTEGSRFLVPR